MSQQLRRPVVEVVEVVGLQRELILRVARAAADADVLRRPEEQSVAPGTLAELAAQPRDDCVGVDLALGERLQRDEHAGPCSRRAAAAGERHDRIDGRIRLDDVARSRSACALMA